MVIIIKPHNTAIKRPSGKCSRPLKEAIKWLKDKQNTILDYGCGRGGDITWLSNHGYDAIGYDDYHPFGYGEKPNKLFDIVTLIYVINAIPWEDDRIKTIKDAWSYVKPEGMLYIATRTPKDVENSRSNGWRYYNDGYLTSESRGTFQKGFDEDTLLDIIHNYGLCSDQKTIWFNKSDKKKYASLTIEKTI